MNTKNLVLGMCFSILLLSCSKDENENSYLTEAKISAKMDSVTDDVSQIVDEQYNIQAAPAGRASSEFVALALPSCATVNTTIVGTTWTRILTFDNCTLQNGNVLDGTITISGNTDFSAPTQTISYTFDNFTHNNILVTGNRTMVRTLQSTAAQADIHPVANIAFDFTLTFPNGAVYQRVGNRIREMIIGYNTPLIFIDNIYSVTGSWTTTFPSGLRTSTITTPLRIEANCANIVSGVISVVGPTFTSSIDYGNGDCDNQAILTINGSSTAITLGNN